MSTIVDVDWDLYPQESVNKIIFCIIPVLLALAVGTFVVLNLTFLMILIRDKRPSKKHIV